MVANDWGNDAGSHRGGSLPRRRAQFIYGGKLLPKHIKVPPHLHRDQTGLALIAVSVAEVK
jgi:hypothetical protein